MRLRVKEIATYQNVLDSSSSQRSLSPVAERLTAYLLLYPDYRKMWLGVSSLPLKLRMRPA